MSKQIKQHSEISNELNLLKERLYNISAQNLFLNVSPNKLYLTEQPDENRIKKLYTHSLFLQKEYGLSTTLKISSFLKWKAPSKDKFYLSPLILESCEIQKLRKIETEYRIVVEDDSESFINPILVHALNQFFDVNLKEVDPSSVIDLIKVQLENEATKIDLVDVLDDGEKWQLINVEAIGNFNYKKSLLGKDYEEIAQSKSAALEELFGVKPLTNSEFSESVKPVLPIDETQLKTIIHAKKSSVAIQGPPGTGKSHTIVNLISDYIAEGKKVLFVSQKKSALDVVYNRLKQLKIEHLASFFNGAQNEKKRFYELQKKSWEQFSERYSFSETKTEFFDESVLDYFTGDYMLKAEELVKTLALSSETKENIKFEGKAPTYEEWSAAYEMLFEFENLLLSHFQIPYISKAPFINLNRTVFKENEAILKLESRIFKCQKVLNDIAIVQNKFALKKNIKAITEMALAASILKMVDLSQLNLLNKESKEYKSFSNWAKKYDLIQSKVRHAEKANAKWKLKPSKSEITELIDLLKHNHAPRGIFGIIKRRNDRLVNAFEGFDANISNTAKLQLLEQLRSEWNLKAELDEVAIKLKHNFGVDNPDTQLREILMLRSKLDQISTSSYLQILEHEQSTDLITELNELHPLIQNYNHLAKFTFLNTEDLELNEEVTRIKELIEILPKLKEIGPELEMYFNLSPAILEYIRLNKKPLSYLNTACIYANLLEEVKIHFAYNQLSGLRLKKAIENALKNAVNNRRNNAVRIRTYYQNEWLKLEDLLNTPASKLSQENKDLKKAYKRQKRSLVHELGKKQRFKSVKDFTDETWDYISRFIPVWIMNPLAVSERLSNVKEMFDVVIFDESSQIPLEDAIPAVFRAKKIVVVGDEKQMPPTNFFTQSTSSETLLDKANLTLSKEMLKWHYRSEHPKLIQFSNSYFYDDELLTIPPSDIRNPVEFNLVNGVFEEGKNSEEAKQIAKYLTSQAKNNESAYAVVAFSKEQENEIRKQLRTTNLNVDDLFISNLENVQGIERDNVVISIGYGRNREGVFRLNFGPINKEGGLNRLNVLFSRAKQRMIVFSSVRSEDFGMSDNNGVVCLRDFLKFCEPTQNISSIPDSSEIIDLDKYDLTYYNQVQGFECFIQHQTKKVLLFNPKAKKGDLMTFYQLLKERFSKVELLIYNDLWANPDSFRSKIDRFFKE